MLYYVSDTLEFDLQIHVIIVYKHTCTIKKDQLEGYKSYRGD